MVGARARACVMRCVCGCSCVRRLRWSVVVVVIVTAAAAVAVPDLCCALCRWGESDADEVVEQIERIYAAAVAGGGFAGGAGVAAGEGGGASSLTSLTWDACMANITAAVTAGAWRRRRLAST